MKRSVKQRLETARRRAARAGLIAAIERRTGRETNGTKPGPIVNRRYANDGVYRRDGTLKSGSPYTPDTGFLAGGHIAGSAPARKMARRAFLASRSRIRRAVRAARADIAALRIAAKKALGS